MTLMQALEVRHTVTYQGKPLIAFSNLPGPDPELTPAQARALAAGLLQAADECERVAKQAKVYGPLRREYPITASAELTK